MHLHLLTLILSATPFLSLAAPTTSQPRQLSPPSLPYPDGETADSCPVAFGEKNASLGPFVPLLHQNREFSAVTYSSIHGRRPVKRHAASDDGSQICRRVGAFIFANQDIAIRTQIVRLLPFRTYVFSAAVNNVITTMIAWAKRPEGEFQGIAGADMIQYMAPGQNQATMEFGVSAASDVYFTMAFGPDGPPASGEVGLFSLKAAPSN